MYKESITKTVETIKLNPFIEINRLIINEPATPELIDSFEMIAGIRLPEKVKAFYLFANGFICAWTVKQDLPPAILNKLRDEGEQLDFDYSKPLGSINILPIQDMLMDKYWKTPYQEVPEATREIQFYNQNISQGNFAKKIKIFDAYDINCDEECMALLTDFSINDESCHLILLDNSLSDWRQSHIIDFETYILSMCETRFTIPSRKRLFSKKHPDKISLLSYKNLDKENLIPALFKEK
jgi:hypothetical protein